MTKQALVPLNLNGQKLTGMANGVLSNDGAAYGQVAPDFAPADHGFISWTTDPCLVENNITPTTGTLYLIGQRLRIAQTISKSVLYATSAGSAASVILGLYDSAGTRRAQSAATTVGGVGQFAPVYTAAYAAPLGFYWAALLVVSATTSPIFGAYNSTSAFSAIGSTNLAAASYRFCTNGTGLSALPASITPSSNSISVGCEFWGATA